jgi:hypothetical protein
LARSPHLVFLLCLAAPLGLLGAEPVPAPERPAKAEGPRLSGRWGLGFDNIPGASAGSNLVPGLATANAASVRYWINESLAWDGLFALNMSSQPSGGAGAAGVPAGTDQRGYGVGTVMKWNARRPTPWLLAQVLGRASLASLSQIQNDGSGNGQTTTTFGLGIGAGFEAFIPLWDSLSIEGNVGLNFSSSQTKLEGGVPVAQSGSSLDISGTGFSPLNVAVHLYF